MRRYIVYVALLVVALPFVSANHMQSGSGRIIAFDHKTGNEWWVEVVLTGQDAGSVAEVWAMDGMDPWTKLEKKSWGAWGASFHIELGKMVRFKAVWTGGAEMVSCYFTHPDGLERCDVPPSPSSSDVPFDATFSNVKGNDWWVEVKVTGTERIATVHARVNCQLPWKELTLRSWGSWAASFYIAPNSKVDFVATSTKGNQEYSAGYIWPKATPTSACSDNPTPTPTPTSTTSAPPPTTFQANFLNVKGNEWWVETKVTGNQPITLIEARVDCAAWKPLTLRSWGAWAASFHIPAESIVELRAKSNTGTYDQSGGYVWPEAFAAPGCFTAAWPQDGSFSTYYIEVEEFATDPETGDTYRFQGSGNERISWTSAGGWVVECDFDGSFIHQPASGTPTYENITFEDTMSYPVPRGPVPATIGATVQIEYSQGCFIVTLRERVLEQTNRQTTLRATEGHPVVLSVYHAQTRTLEEQNDYYWELELGLMVEWSTLWTPSDGGYTLRIKGTLIDNDALVR